MDFRIADTFTASLARLTGEEQKLVKTTAFDLQMNPVNPGMQLHRIDTSKDKNFWSARVGRDIRLILHRTDNSLLLCYVDHHDDAYRWAERRKIERHPVTGAAQLVEIRELVREIHVPIMVETPAAPSGQPNYPLADVSDQDFLAYGTPSEWIADLRNADEESLLDLLNRLPSEASESLLELATGGTPSPARTISATKDAFTHPDALRRFRPMASSDELQRALEYPWERWTVFLHPDQEELVRQTFNGPARVSGSAGTGKTVVALHRAVHLAKRSGTARILLTTFSSTLALFLRQKIQRLTGSNAELASRIDVKSVAEVGPALFAQLRGNVPLVDDAQVKDWLAAAARAVETSRFSMSFLWDEWTSVVDDWQIKTVDEYRNVARLGRKTRLGGQQREALWKVFQHVLDQLSQNSLMTSAGINTAVAESYATMAKPYSAVVVDECQDLSVSQLRLLISIAGTEPDSLFFAGDLGQRVFQTPFSWRSIGIDVRGRSRTLRVNYRTSHEIRTVADRLLPDKLADVDGVIESRAGTVSAFNGIPPEILVRTSQDDEVATVSEWIAARLAEGIPASEIGVFVRSSEQVERARRSLQLAGIPFSDVGVHPGSLGSGATIATMHLAKGLEFRAVVVMCVDEDVLPLASRIGQAADESELENILDTERQLLYVACTRARDRLLVSGVQPGSEFVEDLAGRLAS